MEQASCIDLHSRPAFDGPWEAEANQPALAETHVFSPRLVNEFRFVLNRWHSTLALGTPGIPRVLDVAGGAEGLGGAWVPQAFTENAFDISDVVNFSRGPHSVKAGVEFRRNLENGGSNQEIPGTILTIDLDLLLGGGDRHFRSYDVMPDGQTFVFFRWPQLDPATQLVGIIDWFEELKRLCPTGK